MNAPDSRSRQSTPITAARAGTAPQEHTRQSVELGLALVGWHLVRRRGSLLAQRAHPSHPLAECQGRLSSSASPLLPLDLPADGGGKGVKALVDAVPDSPAVANGTALPSRQCSANLPCAGRLPAR